ncbi:MAG: hypothetical protein CO170_02835 [candidate division SR1 bacterium CG_4_9_14_3_um_filter_40_9]|nr:MAG: hypothetical protein CO170_02835 [candidate division SR1 bacterium CG_4_9_14_3_um_filter_40_9]
MNKKLYKIIFSSFGVLLIVAVFFLVDNFPSANAAIRVAEAEVAVPAEPVYDYSADDSLQKYLSVDTPFIDLNYVPGDLLPIDSAFTANSSKAYKLREEAGIQFADMARHFRNDFKGDKLWIASAYRSNDLQEYMLKKGCSRVRCAQAGTSEHQAGLALDLKVFTKGGKGYTLYSGNRYYQWFADNAHKRGFHNTYQKGIDVDGQMVEGRHWRYMGTGLATKLREQGQTFAEYYDELTTKSEQLTMDFDGMR